MLTFERDASWFALQSPEKVLTYALLLAMKLALWLRRKGHLVYGRSIRRFWCMGMSLKVKANKIRVRPKLSSQATDGRGDDVCHLHAGRNSSSLLRHGPARVPRRPVALLAEEKWSRNRPDFNPDEELFAIIRQDLNKQEQAPRLAELEMQLKSEWNDSSHLCSPMPWPVGRTLFESVCLSVDNTYTER